MIEDFAKKMSKHPTKSEKFLYYKLCCYFKDRESIRHFKYVQNQVVIGWYIADILIPAKHLIIEIDGNQHNSINGKTDDIIRDGYLKSLGFDILRYSNHDVFSKTQQILQYIDIWASLENEIDNFFKCKTKIKQSNIDRKKHQLLRYEKSDKL